MNHLFIAVLFATHVVSQRLPPGFKSNKQMNKLFW